MFGKKDCRRCGNKTSKKNDFCPTCGNSFGKINENFGMLGKNDEPENVNDFESVINNLTKSLFGGVGGKMIGGMIRMMEKEMEKEMKRTTQQPQPRSNFQLFINGKKINIHEKNESNRRSEEQELIDEEPKKIILNQFSRENIKKFSKLSKTEPKTNIRRLSNKVIYEIDIPGVNSVKDTSIINLENSIEIKALSKNKAYFKTIPINLPITNYKLLKNKLILEFGLKN